MKILSFVFLLLVPLQVYAQLPAGPLVHLDADVGVVAVDDMVLEWRDVNTPTIKFIPPTLTNQPIAILGFANGHKGVRFDGGGSLLRGPSIFPVNKDYTLCVIAKINNFAATNNLVSGTTHALFLGGGVYPKMVHGDFNSIAISKTPVLSSASIIIAAYDQSNTVCAFHVNGVAGDSAVIGVNTDSTIFIGAFAGSNLLAGDIAEVIIYPRFLTDSERIQLENHLFDKYAIKRPQPQDTTFTEIPQHFQLFPRDEHDSAEVRIAGRVYDSKYDSVYVIVFKNGEFMQRTSKPLFYPKGVAAYELLTKIHAEQAEYDYYIHLQSKEKDTLLAVRDSITCGDVFLIDGQSNTVFGGDVHNYYQNEYCRTFGLNASSNPTDTLWARSTGNIGSNLPNVGGWGIRLQQRILEEQGIPTCFINGGVGGSTVEQHQRYDPEPLTLSTIYGSMLYRVQKAKLANAAKAMFWYQGESNTFPEYYGNFKALYNDWNEDYPNLKKFYIFQVHMGCNVGGEQGALRNLLRTIKDSLPSVEQVSVMGISGHDGCHFSTVGYSNIGDMVYKKVARDFYRSEDTVEIDPPNIQKAFYRNLSHTEIVLEFSPLNSSLVLQADTIVSSIPASLKDYFYLNDNSGKVSQISVEGNKIVLHLFSPSIAENVTYLPNVYYHNSTSVVYEGPWLTNARGVGALSFWRFPITDSVTLSVPSINDRELYLSAYPNPFEGKTTLQYSVPNTSTVKIEVRDVLGRLVETVVDQVIPEGNYEKILDRNANEYTSGVYYCRITVGDRRKTIRLVMD